MPPSKLLNRYRRDQSGATAIEYGLLAAMIAIFLVGLMSMGGAVDAMYESLMAIVDAIFEANGSGS